jgi:ABC transporter with metal-binding/Fe-S-binding domain ATP-binding protein
MNVAALFSGGKDSVFALYIVQQWGWNISNLITIYPKRKDSWMFHSVNIKLTELLAESLDISHITQISFGNKEDELNDLKEILKDLNIDGVISGAIASEYQRTRIEKICHELKIKSFSPIWHKNQELILKELIKAEFEVMIVGVFAQGFNRNWLGRKIDKNFVNDILNLNKKYHINIGGEGGEFETIVINGKNLKKKLIID